MEMTPAILLRRSRWSETSLIVTWLSERCGTLRTVARGARRPGSAFAGRLDLFYGAEISIQSSRSGDLHTLREVGGVTPFDAGRAGNAGFYLASYFAELSGLSAPPMHPAEEIYNLLGRGLAHLQVVPAGELALRHFERELCRILGIFDAAGKVSPQQALTALCGSLPRSRSEALSLLSPKKSLAGPGD
jgi:DNA repair protein RecO (recombination protein O)